MKPSSPYIILLAITIAFHPGILWSQTPAQDDVGETLLINEFFNKSPEELYQLSTYLTTGTGQGWLKTPAAAHIITREDMEDSGHNHIAEQLRMAPGLMVSQAIGTSWAISTRSFQSIFSNKQLVLQDGREIYSPIYGGVYWGQSDLPVEILNSIEIIRGPGATLWGSNAVNGVINISTLHAKEAQENIATFGGGNEDQYAFSFRKGGELFGGHYYTWGKWANHRPMLDLNDDSNQTSRLDKGGFRGDFPLFGGDTELTFRAEYYDQDTSHRVTGPLILVDPTSPVSSAPNYYLDDFTGDIFVHGGSVHGDLKGSLDNGLEWKLGSYYSLDKRHWGAISLDFQVVTYEVDFQVKQQFGLHTIQAGVRHRTHEYDTHEEGLPQSLTNLVGAVATPFLTYPSLFDREDINSAFIQDTLAIKENLNLLIGTKFEDNITGDYWNPSARLWWYPDDKTTLWGAFSIAHNMPGYEVRNSTVTYGYRLGGLGSYFPLTLQGNPTTRSGELHQWELGWRHLFQQGFSLDVATFLGDYKNLNLGGQRQDTNSADSYGGEIALNWIPSQLFHIRSSVSFSDTDIQGPDANPGSYSAAKWRGNLLANITPPGEIRYFLGMYASERASPHVPGYIRTDIGATWMPNHEWEASLSVQNLFDPSHPEDYSSFRGTAGYEVPRSLCLQLRRWF